LYGLPTPGFPNVNFEAEAHCEAADHWNFEQSVKEECYATIEHGRQKKRPSSPTSQRGSDKKVSVQRTMENFFLLRSTRPDMAENTPPTPKSTTAKSGVPNLHLSKSEILEVSLLRCELLCRFQT